MTQEEARAYMIKETKKLRKMHIMRNKSVENIRGQIAGMMKAFRAAGIISEGWQEILDECLDLI